MLKLHLLALLAVVLPWCSPAQQIRFSNLLAFAGTNQVRVECELGAATAVPEVTLHGLITHAGTGATLWQGALKQVSVGPGGTKVSATITSLHPELWSPASPTLYWLQLTAGHGDQVLAERRVRFGFRSMEISNGQFLLNAHPVFLRGIAISPPGRGIPDETGLSRKFAEDYVRFLKSQNFNMFRLSIDDSQVWFDVCDELGMMLYAGHYGAPLAADTAKKAPPTDFNASMTAYQKLFSGFASHPSIVEYFLSNELPHEGTRGKAFGDYLTRACAELKRWDNTRPYIGNAGYGEGREGDVCDVHRYWGWYYNSFLTYYNLRDKLQAQPLFGDPARNQPLTFTECVGSFTGSSGEFNVVRSKQLAPRLGWIGHTETPLEDALAYQSFMAGQACESFRRMRPLNPRLAGLMPFTILFYNWSEITSFSQMRPKPVVEAMRRAYQPVLLSWELWTPQVYAGRELRAVAHVINDDDANRSLADAVLRIAVRAADGREFAVESIRLPVIPHFGTWRRPVSFKLPANLPTGDYTVSGQVLTPAGVRSTNFAPLFVAGREWTKVAPELKGGVFIYDPPGRTAAALRKNNLSVTTLADPMQLPQSATALVIGEGVWDPRLSGAKAKLRSFVQSGGRILCLQPNPQSFDSSWLPEAVTFFTSSPNSPDYPPRSRPFREQMNINPERPDHPVFDGLSRRRLALWSDYTAWDQTQPGFPKVYPVGSGFKLNSAKSLAQTAILADYDRGLEGIALCEMFAGNGSIILSAFDSVARAGLDPAADRLLVNLTSYAASRTWHDIQPLVNGPIYWGDFPSERGTICGTLNSLIVNAEWIPAPNGPRSKPMAANTGAWNMLPGEQFVPRGRSPFGDYGYSTASSLRDPDSEETRGSGFFWARIPAGKRAVATLVRNPNPAPVSFAVNAGGPTGAVTATIAAGQAQVVRTALPVGATTVCVRFEAGAKNLVLEQTEFE